MQRIKNTDTAFYDIIGPVFGSRKIQRVTKDRFYDDDEKEWIVQLDSNKNIVYVISVTDGIIKNIYSESPEATTDALKEIYNEISYGVVPVVYKALYISAGYGIEESEMVNFVRIIGGKYERQD